MAAKRKPAIEKTQGIVDDIVRPVWQRFASAIGESGSGKVARKLDLAAHRSVTKRAKSYDKRGKTTKVSLMDAEVGILGPKKSPAKNYKKAKKKPEYSDYWKTRAHAVNYANIQKAKKK